MDIPRKSADSQLSWNTFLSRTSISTLSCAIFSERLYQSVNGLEDVIRAVTSLRLRLYRYEELAREEALGEGETYLVEKCSVAPRTIFAVKHLKMGNTADDKLIRRRLTALTFEAKIMRHPPLRAHPNIPSLIGYGWNLRGNLVMPFLVVEYAPFGTMREYLNKQTLKLAHIEILLGDVASAIGALHACGIVHGDVKLDNVLVFPSRERPTNALAKLTDFGHALIVHENTSTSVGEALKYGGTSIYNAPEVETQDSFHIDRSQIWKCDVWAFGLLVWEACIRGEDYMSYLAKKCLIPNASINKPGISVHEMLRHAKQCLPSQQLGSPMFLRIILHKTIQEDPAGRVAKMGDLPFENLHDAVGLQAGLALHFQQPTPNYEIFRLDIGKEIIWDHQQQILKGLKHTHVNHLAKDRGPISWQIALCHYLGFGTSRSLQDVHEYVNIAKLECHPLALGFGHLLQSHAHVASDSEQECYAARISALIRSNSAFSKGMPQLVKAFFDADTTAIFNLLSDGAPLNSCAVDGCSIFHWLFIFEGEDLKIIVEKLAGDLSRRLVVLPMCSRGEVHDQWPLQIYGSPLAVAISMNSLTAVKALLSLGADPFSIVYHETQFPSEDSRAQWTAFHVAVKYHCSDFLVCLLKHTGPAKQANISSLACVLSFSTVLERLAMHGSDHIQQLDETIRLVRSIQPLGASDTSGRTGLMQAIDFQDLDVVDALLRADKELAKTPFLSPKHPDIFTYPIQFAAQIAARRDVPESLAIPQLINSYTDDLGSGSTSLDYTGKTILHLAVTGASSLVTQWILKERPGLIHAQDFSGQTPLHYCASAVNCDLLLDTGADIDHADKNGITALHRACLSGATEIVARLLKRTPRLDLRNNIYGTPIHCGVFSGSIDVVMELVSHGAPLNATDKKGNTAIHVAVKLNLHNILRLLVQYKADVRLKNIYGRDASAIAIQGGRAGNFRVLQILGHHKEVLEEQQNFETANANTIDSSSEGESIGMQEMRPDFLWGEATLQPNETPSPRQSTAAKHYTHGEEQETYDQRTIRLVEFDQFISTTAQQYFPNFLERHWSKKAMVMLLSIFFEDAIWQPGLSEVILEVLARAACDLALLMDTYPRSPPLDIRRAVLWARYLLQCNGVDTAVQVEANQTFPKHDLTLESKFHDRSFRHPPLKALRANGPLYRGDLRSGNLPHWLKYFGWLDPVWMYLQHNDPHTVPTPLSQDADVQPRPHEGETQPFIIANEFLRDGLDLPYFLGFLQQQFHIVDTHESHQDVVDKIKENMGGDNPHNSHELKLSNAPDVEASDDSVPFCQAQAENGAKAETDPGHHINLATDWIVDIFMSRKPETMLPERLKSDVKMLVRWETRMYRMSPPESETTQARYTSSLFHKFPQLSRNGIRWRENLCQEYFDWKFKTTSDQPPYLETTEQNEFFETIYLLCTRGFEEIQLDESESKIGRFVQPFTADGKDTSEVSTINDEISGRYSNIDDWMFNVASKPDKQMDESLEPISAEKSAYHSGGPISGVIRQEYQGLAERDSFSLFGFGGSPLLGRGSSSPLD